MNMMNKCAKFHKESPSGKKLSSLSRARLNFWRRPILCTTLYRNLMRASNFGSAIDRLSFEFFHRTCLSTSSIPWCKKVKNNQKLNSRCPAISAIFSPFNPSGRGLRPDESAISVSPSSTIVKIKVGECTFDLLKECWLFPEGFYFALS